MDRRFRWPGVALLSAVAIVSVVLLFGVFRVAGPPRWPSDAIYVPQDVATIGQALENAPSGATIVLQAQDEAFRGSITIDTANLTLTSARGRAKLEASGTEPVLTIRGDGVVVRGLEIVSESIGIRIESARCRIEDTRVQGAPLGVQLLHARGCEIREIEVHGGRIGLELVSSGGNILTDIVVRGASEFGLKALGSWDNVLEAVAISDAPIGLSLGQGSSTNELRECRIDRASTAGVELLGSNDNLIVDSAVRNSRVGIALEGVTGNEILGCEIDEVVVAGLLFQQAVQNRATENTIGVSQDAGILLDQSAENALSYNGIEECGGAGIRLDGSDLNLLIGNTLAANGVGIDCDRSSHGRILRNTVLSADPSGIGLLLTGGAENRLLDNHVRGGALGLLLRGSRGNTLLRNRIENQAAVGVSLVSGSHENSVAENHVADSLVGIVAGDSGGKEILDNRITGNDIGLLLVRSGLGVRIEGNTIEANRIGVRLADAVDIAGIEPSPGGGVEIGSPLVANNVFVRNESLDVSNETSSPVYVGGNWWGGVTGERDTASAKISDGVHLEGSAWKGTLAVGAEAGIAEEILGRILQYALTEAGFRVIDLVGMGDSDRVGEALRMQDVDFIWWRTTERALAEVVVGEGEIDVTAIPVTRRWIVVVSDGTAQRLPESTVSALAELISESGETFRYAAPRAFGEAASASFEEEYGLRESVGSVSWAETLGEAETLLKFGAVEAVIVDSLEETLTFSGFVALEDDLAAFESTGILVASRPGLLVRFPEVEGVLAGLARFMTTSAIHDLISRVRLLQREPEAVAAEYLEQRRFLGE